MARKLHIGGHIAASGWEVLDANPGPVVDHVGNAADLSNFADNTFSEIYASHVVEHFDYKNEILSALKEWRRVMLPGGVLYVSVPDLDVLSRLFLNRETLTRTDRFWVMRMIFGGHLDQYDYHRVGLNDELLADVLGVAGFTDVVKVADFGLFQDDSALKFKGVSISLNMRCCKPI